MNGEKVKKILIILALISLILFPFSAYAGSTATSGITAETIFDRVMRDLNQVDNSGIPIYSFFTQNDFIQWADEAVREIIYKTNCLETGVSNIVLIENQRKYSITSSFLNVEKVEYDSGDTTQKAQIFDLDRAPFNKLRYGKGKEGGAPKNYSVWNDTLFVYPIPRSSQSGNTLYLYAIPLPTGVTAAASPIETPSYFDFAIQNYIRARAIEKKYLGEGGDRYRLIFEQAIKTYLINVSKRDFVAP